MNLSSQLRAAIRQSRMSATSLAKKSGVPQPMITRFLNGAELRSGTMDRLAEYFGLAVARYFEVTCPSCAKAHVLCLHDGRMFFPGGKFLYVCPTSNRKVRRGGLDLQQIPLPKRLDDPVPVVRVI